MADRKPKPKLQRSAAKVAAAGNGNGGSSQRVYGESGERCGATLVVTEEQLDHMFVSWPLEDKLMCVQLWLDRLEA
jgi:hypothetical protein